MICLNLLFWIIVIYMYLVVIIGFEKKNVFSDLV